MFELPTYITINAKDYPIRNKGDYRMVLDCFNALNDIELDSSNRIYTSLIIFYDGMTSIDDLLSNFGDHLKEAVEEMCNFFNCGQPNGVGAHQPYKLVDWKQDAQLIASGINQVAKMEIRAVEYMHWWTFMGYYLSIGESAFSTVVSIRSKIKKGSKLEKYEQEFKKDNPQYFVWDFKSVDTKQQENEIMNLWNK